MSHSSYSGFFNAPYFRIMDLFILSYTATIKSVIRYPGSSMCGRGGVPESLSAVLKKMSPGNLT